jgi:hypothetical protein
VTELLLSLPCGKRPPPANQQPPSPVVQPQASTVRDTLVGLELLPRAQHRPERPVRKQLGMRACADDDGPVGPADRSPGAVRRALGIRPVRGTDREALCGVERQRRVAASVVGGK